MSYKIEIDGENITTKVLRNSINWRTNSNGVPDSLDFSITQTSNPYHIELDADVAFYINENCIFRGELLQRRLDHKSAVISKVMYTFQDCTRTYSKGDPVAEIYKNKTVLEIVTDLKNRYPQLFDLDIENVNCDILIDYSYFDHLKFPDVLKELSARTAYDFYFDENKKLHFFKKGSISAPFNAVDNDGSLQNNSVNIAEKADRIVNQILVEGDEYTTSEDYDDSLTADGVKLEYKISDKYGTLFSLQYFAAIIFPSVPRCPNPPGTQIPEHSLNFVHSSFF